MATVSSTNDNVSSSGAAVVTVPLQSSVPTGTITTGTNKAEITGVGTNFTKFNIGDWIIDTTNFECRRIISIQGDLYAQVSPAFSNALAGVTLIIVVRPNLTKITLISAAGGKCNNVTLPTGVPVIFEKTINDSVSAQQRILDPLIVDGTGGAVFIVTQQ